MTEKQMEKMGFYKSHGDKYIKWCDARDIEIKVTKEDDERDVWNKIYDVIFDFGVERGKLQKSEEIKTALGL